jgi:GLPGLI family protein
MKIVYGIRQNGKDVNNDSIVVYTSKESSHITRPSLIKESQFIDIKNMCTVQLLEKDETASYIFKKNYKEEYPEIVHEYTQILGFNSLKANLNIRSNRIEVYYTDETEFKSTPFLYLAGIPGVILKVIRNGNYEVYAKRIEYSDEYVKSSLLPVNNLIDVSEPEFTQKLIESRYKTINIFNSEILSFSEFSENNLNKEIIKTSKGSVVLKKVNLPPVTENTIVIAEVTVSSNGDAYDRTGSVFAIPVSGKRNFLEGFEKGFNILPAYKFGIRNGIALTEDYEPPVELVRFITSFGAGHFSGDIKIENIQWKDSITYRLEISDIVKCLNNSDYSDIYIGCFIGTWDNGGHKINLRLKYFEEPEYSNSTKWLLPLFNTVNYLEMSGQSNPDLFRYDTLSVNISIPEGLKNIRLKFITTGHGNDEFIPRMHKILADNKEVFSMIPWRTDCATFRENNPASGNFLNGMSSSDYSRSNWCPGMVVYPFEIRLGDLKPGNHNFKVIIECGENSYWNVSGCLIGE